MTKTFLFCHKIKSKTLINNLRHAFLEMNVIEYCVKLQSWETNIKGDIHVQRTKVNEMVNNS